MFFRIFATFCCLFLSSYFCQPFPGEEGYVNFSTEDKTSGEVLCKFSNGDKASGDEVLLKFPMGDKTSDLPRTTKIPVYLAVRQRVPFYNSLQLCNSMGLELASISSEEEENAIEKYISTQNPSYGAFEGYWIAGVRRTLNGTDDFGWITKGKPFEYQKYTEGRILDNYGGNEHCLEFVVDGPPTYFLWNDINCDEELQFICQTVTLCYRD